MSEQSLLKLFHEKYNMNEDDVLDELENMNNKKILDKHMTSFSNIWQGTGSDTRWKTYLPSNNKRGRKLIASSSRENIEKQILAYYKQTTRKALQFQTLYYEWLDLKRLEVSNATIERIHSSYMRYYELQPINKISITNISYLYIKEFILSTVKKYDMNYKSYCNFTSVLRGVLQYAIDKQLITTNPMANFHIGKNVLRSPDVKNKRKEVFSIEERNLIEDAIWKSYRENPVSTVPLAILLDFYTGLRSGELTVLTWSDIADDTLHVHRTETSYSIINPDGTKGKVTYAIKESPKSSAGFRDVILIPKAIEVLKEIYRFNQSHGWDSEYIFLVDNHRIIRKNLDTQIRKYCNQLGIPPRSMHKIRKYYISSLKLANLEDDEIRRLAGHKDITTTLNSYCFSILSDEETKNRLTSAL